MLSRFHHPSTRARHVVVVALVSSLLCGFAHAVDADVNPTNNFPNPYRAEKPWGHLPNDRPWGALSAITIDNDKLLLTIGTPGTAGNPPRSLTEPNSIVELPNGDFLISEGHNGQRPEATPDTVARISRFTADGKFISSFGKLGSGPGEFRTPHDLALDAQGRLLVADRGNNRIQVLDLNGRFISEMKQFSRPSGIALLGDTLYVADSESNGVAPHPGWTRGIRIGSYSTGQVRYRIPDPDDLKGTSSAEGIAVDAAGNIYGAEVGPERVSRYSRSEPRTAE
jgi:sugar lactone lactonase YvrE